VQFFSAPHALSGKLHFKIITAPHLYLAPKVFGVSFRCFLDLWPGDDCKWKSDTHQAVAWQPVVERAGSGRGVEIQVLAEQAHIVSPELRSGYHCSLQGQERVLGSW